MGIVGTEERDCNKKVLRTILRKGPSFVAKKVFYTSKFLRECARANDRARNLGVIHYLLCVDRLTHVKIYS
jgi:hypothetical protein